MKSTLYISLYLKNGNARVGLGECPILPRQRQGHHAKLWASMPKAMKDIFGAQCKVADNPAKHHETYRQLHAA